MKIIGVNGIRTHGSTSTDIVLREAELRGFDVVDVPLPKRGAFSARFGGKKDGEIIADHSSDGDIVVAHSFGCLRAWHAHNLRDYAGIICLAPAMSRKVKWRNPGRVHCWHSRDDLAVRVGTFLFFHPFGGAGTYGFLQAGINHHSAPGAGHGSYFDGRLLRDISNTIMAMARSNRSSFPIQ